MIKSDPMFWILLAAGSCMLPSAAHADARRELPDCEAHNARCGAVTALRTDIPSQPISAARSDAIKKQRLFETIRQNEGELLREENARMRQSLSPAAKPPQADAPGG